MSVVDYDSNGKYLKSFLDGNFYIKEGVLGGQQLGNFVFKRRAKPVKMTSPASSTLFFFHIPDGSMAKYIEVESYVTLVPAFQPTSQLVNALRHSLIFGSFARLITRIIIRTPRPAKQLQRH